MGFSILYKDRSPLCQSHDYPILFWILFTPKPKLSGEGPKGVDFGYEFKEKSEPDYSWLYCGSDLVV